MMTKMAPQQYCLRWKHHHTNVQSMFTQLLEKERFCDVTLYCSPSFTTLTSDKNCAETPNLRGVSLKAHRVVLAACSELLGSLLGAHEAHGEPVLVIDGAEPRHVRALLDYMYTGEMNVHHSQLAGLLKTAEELRIKGLTDIRWNNKDEPPDDEGVLTATATKITKQPTPDPLTPERRVTPERPQPESNPVPDKQRTPSPDGSVKSEAKSEVAIEEKAYNGGPPPLIKLPIKTSPLRVRKDLSDTESSSPKRRRLISGADHTDDDSISQPKSEQDWRHGNLDISAERVAGWCGGGGGGGGAAGGGGGGEEATWSDDEDEWDAAPADIASFLHTRLKVDGDNSNDDESTLEETRTSSLGTDLPELRIELSNVTSLAHKMTTGAKSSKSGPVDIRFPDVVKLNDYLQHGRRPQFWEENYVRRVMEAVRTKELEMKQAAEILGVSYGTLYGRYRDVYGCINRPYSTPRAGRDVWIPKGPSEVLERLQRGEVNIETASTALGVNPQQLAAYVNSVTIEKHKDFDSVPIDLDSPPKKRSAVVQTNTNINNSLYLKNVRKGPIGPKQQGSVSDDDTSSNTGAGNVVEPATIRPSTTATPPPPGGNSGVWPSIRVANLDSLKPERGSSPSSPSALMRTRPDLTILPASKHDHTT